jgi:hypothetical protein
MGHSILPQFSHYIALSSEVIEKQRLQLIPGLPLHILTDLLERA